MAAFLVGRNDGLDSLEDAVQFCMQFNHAVDGFVNKLFKPLFLIHHIRIAKTGYPAYYAYKMSDTMDQDLENSSASTRAQAAAEPRLLAAEVVERLRDLIIQGELAPGVKLNERVLCERLRTCLLYTYDAAD